MSCYLGKFNIPQYENNDELSNEDCKAFKAITDKMSDTYKRKNHDYGKMLFPKCMMSLVSTTATERYARK